jgi:hypothetical protein
MAGFVSLGHFSAIGMRARVPAKEAVAAGRAGPGRGRITPWSADRLWVG